MICGRGEGALLAWELGFRGTIVVEVVVLGSGVVGSSSGVYQRIKGGRNSKYKAIICKQMYKLTNALLSVF